MRQEEIVNLFILGRTDFTFFQEDKQGLMQVAKQLISAFHQVEGSWVGFTHGGLDFH